MRNEADTQRAWSFLIPHSSSICRCEVIDVLHQAAFQVGSFVFVDVAAFCQFVNHADDFRQELLSLCLVFLFAQVFDRRARRFFVVAILQTTLRNLADALQCRKMMCHIFSIYDFYDLRLSVFDCRKNLILAAPRFLGGQK